MNWKQMLSISLMLFAIFFGAGNMIFPPALGQMAGENYMWALLGFIVTDAGIAILGIAAVVLIGNSIFDLPALVSRKFAIVLSMGVYLLIGPLFALPRTGSVSFELAMLPFLGSDINVSIASIAFTAVFFAITYYLSSKPNKIVDIVGKVLTPILLLAIACIFVGAIMQSGTELNGAVFGATQPSVGEYTSIPFFKGMIEGYLALDGPAGLAFAIIVINAIRGHGITAKKNIAKYTCLCGLGAAFFLSIVYFALAYVGAITPGSYANGGALLSVVTTKIFGSAGGVILGIAVLFACLTTSIGLTTSFDDFWMELKPKANYKKVAFIVSASSFLIANVGLSTLIQISLPILIMIYPVTVVLMITSFFRNRIQHRRMVYVMGMVFAFCVSFISGLDNAQISLGVISEWVRLLPFYTLGIGWILPGILGSLFGYLPIFDPCNRWLSKQDQIEEFL